MPKPKNERFKRKGIRFFGLAIVKADKDADRHVTPEGQYHISKTPGPRGKKDD